MRFHIAVLNMGWVRVELAERLLQVVAYYRTHGLSIEFSGVGVQRRPIASNRNRIVRDCPKEADVLVMIDSDCIPPPNFLDAYAPEYDILGLPMPIYRDGDICTGIVLLDGQETLPVGEMVVVEASAVAGGVFFINRRVLDHPEMHAGFEDWYDNDGVLTHTEEHTYCEKARRLGFRVWAHLGYPLGHVKEVDIARINARKSA